MSEFMNKCPSTHYINPKNKGALLIFGPFFDSILGLTRLALQVLIYRFI